MFGTGSLQTSRRNGWKRLLELVWFVRGWKGGFFLCSCQQGSDSTIFVSRLLPSGQRLHNYGKSPYFMGKSTISMAIFNRFLFVYQAGYICLSWVDWELWQLSDLGNAPSSRTSGGSAGFFIRWTALLSCHNPWSIYPMVMTNSSPWKDAPFLVGKPSISMGHVPIFSMVMLVITRGYIVCHTWKMCNPTLFGISCRCNFSRSLPSTMSLQVSLAALMWRWISQLPSDAASRACFTSSSL